MSTGQATPIDDWPATSIELKHLQREDAARFIRLVMEEGERRGLNNLDISWHPEKWRPKDAPPVPAGTVVFKGGIKEAVAVEFGRALAREFAGVELWVAITDPRYV